MAARHEKALSDFFRALEGLLFEIHRGEFVYAAQLHRALDGVVPEVGTPGTLTVGSDDYPLTVTHVSSGGRVLRFRRDRFRSGVFLPAASTEEETARFTTRGWRDSRGCRVYLGRREHHMDPHF